MSAVNPVGNPERPDFSSGVGGTKYKTDLDNAIRSAERVALCFSPHEVSEPINTIPYTDVDTGADTLALGTDDGYVDDMQVQVATSDTLPVPLAASTNYFIVSAVAGTMKLSLTEGGAAITLTTQGAGAHTITPQPSMLIQLNDGFAFDGLTLTEVDRQNTATITAPVTDPRIDRVVVDILTGVLSIIAGSEAVTPLVPALTVGKLPVAQILLAITDTQIVNANITDERGLKPPTDVALLHKNYTQVSRTTQGIFMTYALQAGILAEDDQALRITAWGTLTSSTGATIDARFNATPTAFHTLTVTSNNMTQWRMEIIIARTGAAAQKMITQETQYNTSSPTTSVVTQAGATDVATMSAALIIDFYLNNPVGTVTQEGMIIERLP